MSHPTHYIPSVHRRKDLPILASSGRPIKIPKPTKEHPMYVSPSELSTFLRCRVKWLWGVQLELEPNEGFNLREMGSLFASIQDEYYLLPWQKRNERRMTKIAQRLIAKTKMENLSTEDRELLLAISGGYARWASNPNPKGKDLTDPVIGLRDCTPEEKFCVPITKDKRIWLRGRLDMRFKPHGEKSTMAMQEGKMRKGIDFNPFEVSLQVMSYLHSMRYNHPGFKRYKAYPTVSRRQMPGPRVRAALFGREMFEKSDEEIQQWLTDIQYVCQDMLDPAIYPNKEDSCMWSCDFKQLCDLRGDPKDLKAVVKNEFHVKQWEGKK